MTGNTAEAPSQMILQRASTAGKLHGIFTFMRSRAFPRLGLLFAVALSAAAAPALGWEHWGGDRGGQRFSPLAQSRRPMSAISCAPLNFAPAILKPARRR